MSEIPSQLSAALAGRYRLERELGAGGMATVYLAHDVKHNRKVALKVLRPELAHALGPGRFLREIETTANLRHPHILPLYDSGAVSRGIDGSTGRVIETGGELRSDDPAIPRAAEVLFYVMPYVEGETLRDRLNREKQLPLDDALQIAREVADALSYAHARGVIHRDVKPENILLESGHAVVADFGIARAVSAAGGEKLTQTGLAVGTPSYMSPEQMAGDEEVDGRSDLYALGCVLYEMLGGQPPFTGPTVESLVHQHLTVEPRPITQLRPSVPVEVAGVLQRALAKNPADRFNPVAQFGDALLRSSLGPRSWGEDRRRRIPTVGWVVPALIVMVIGVILLARWSSEPDVPAVVRTVQVTRDPGLEVDPSLSPDGQLIAYASGPPTAMQIYVRQVAGGRVIAVTDDPARNHRWPRWSPDGSRIAYQTEDGIEVAPALGGQSLPLVRLEPLSDQSTTSGFTRLLGFAWSPDGDRIVYAGAAGELLTIVPVDGGEPVRLVVDPAGDSASWSGPHSPAWSPDGRRLAVVTDNPIFVFGGVYFGNEGPSSIWVVPLNGDPAVRVTDDPYLNTSPQWDPDGDHLFFVSDRGGGRDLYRVRVTRTGAPAGEPARITTGADLHTVGLSADGTRVAYAAFRTLSNIWSIAVPQDGVSSGDAARPVTSGGQTIESVDVTADGRWLVFDSDRSGNSEIYKMPADGGEPIQLTTNPAGDYSPAWSSDGQMLAFHSLRDGSRDVFTMNADGSGLSRRTSSPTHELDPDWSPDGTALVFEVLNWDLREGHFSVLPLDRGETRTLGEVGDFARWSPAGTPIVFHGHDGLRLISPDGGESRLLVPVTEEFGEPFYAAWSPDGQTVYYLAKGPRGASIHTVRPTGDLARLLVRFDDPTRQPTRYGFTTDGSRLYLTIGSHESDVWVMELARP